MYIPRPHKRSVYAWGEANMTPSEKYSLPTKVEKAVQASEQSLAAVQ